ncbi:hypothetical protein CANCADRAFT_30081 [Tortispora caseinolytica NRRL Y-17796]|uniref:Guanylate cyclase domain-containing protein n=1 Tax=Tortispora caseinolytica NRRL Y-17796 TaxID=767744 RepID=A0A1E4TIZ8_9ASCO|nr:hypothetical protein CANCADRAFT_30081 [Tortispora caseinolytica NRRL Y-17796]
MPEHLHSDSIRVSEVIRDLAESYGMKNNACVMSVKLKSTEPISMSSGVIGLKTKRPHSLSVDLTASAPKGKVAIIFTDIKSSTELWERDPEMMKNALSIHNELLRTYAAKIGGYVVKTEGDSFMVCFENVIAAVYWALLIQNKLLTQDWPEGLIDTPQCPTIRDTQGNLLFYGLQVRMGIHWGEPFAVRDMVTGRMDYYGPMVNRTARISAAADGGQITLSYECMQKLVHYVKKYRISDPAAFGDINRDITQDENFSPGFRRLSDPTGLDKLDARSQKIEYFKAIEVLFGGWTASQSVRLKLKGVENPVQVYVVFPKNLDERRHHTAKLQSNIETAEAEPVMRRESLSRAAGGTHEVDALSVGAKSESVTDIEKRFQEYRISSDVHEIDVEPSEIVSMAIEVVKLEQICSALIRRRYEETSEIDFATYVRADILKSRMLENSIYSRATMEMMEHTVTRLENSVVMLERLFEESPII